MEANIFETYYHDYCRQIAELDFASIKETLGIELRSQEAIIPFLCDDYFVSKNGVVDDFGNRPNYMVCVILCKYLLLCPEFPVLNKEWTALKDFRRLSQFTNLNVFTSDVERLIVNRFKGRLEELSDASQKLDGKPCDMGLHYDLTMKFNVLPKIEILMLFNDGNVEFPAACSVLFQKQAEHYLDPESLIMTGMAFAQRLIKKLSI